MISPSVPRVGTVTTDGSWTGSSGPRGMRSISGEGSPSIGCTARGATVHALSSRSLSEPGRTRSASFVRPVLSCHACCNATSGFGPASGGDRRSSISLATSSSPGWFASRVCNVRFCASSSWFESPS